MTKLMFGVCCATIFTCATPSVVCIKYHNKLWTLVRLAPPRWHSKFDFHWFISVAFGTMLFTQSDCMLVGRSRCRVGVHTCIWNVQNPYGQPEIAIKLSVSEDNLYWSRSPCASELWCGVGSATRAGLKMNPTWRIRYTATYSIT